MLINCARLESRKYVGSFQVTFEKDLPPTLAEDADWIFVEG